jgi:hypothetical protein
VLTVSHVTIFQLCITFPYNIRELRTSYVAIKNIFQKSYNRLLGSGNRRNVQKEGESNYKYSRKYGNTVIVWT